MSEKTNRNINAVIVERIRSSFGELMGEDEWRDLVAEEITRFKSPTNDYHDKSSPLAKMVRAQIQQKFDEKIREVLSTPHFKVAFDDKGHHAAGDIIGTLVREHAAKMFENMAADIAGRMVGEVVMQINNRLNNNNGYR